MPNKQRERKPSCHIVRAPSPTRWRHSASKLLNEAMRPIWQPAASIQKGLALPNSKGCREKLRTKIRTAEFPSWDPSLAQTTAQAISFPSEKPTDDHSAKTRGRNTIVRASKARSERSADEQQHEQPEILGPKPTSQLAIKLIPSTCLSQNGRPDRPPTICELDRRLTEKSPAPHCTTKAQRECECETFPVRM